MSRGYFPDWDIDLPLGEAEELRIEGILSDIRNGGNQSEVKSDFYLNERIFVEVQDRRSGRGEYRDTGFRASRAELYVLNQAGLNAFHVYRTADLRELESRGLLGHLRDGGTGGDCPTRGYLVTASMIDAGLAFLARGRDALFDQEATP